MSSRVRDTSCVQTCRHVHKRNSRSGGKVVVDVVVVDCVVVVVVSESKKRNCYNRNIFVVTKRVTLHSIQKHSLIKVLPE